MKLPNQLKNFFSFFTLLIADRQLRHYKQLFECREKTYQHQLTSKEHLIEELREKIVSLEFESQTDKKEIKQRFKQMQHLQKQLTETKKEQSLAREKLSALYMTNNKLTQFLETQERHQPSTHATIPHHH